MFKTGHKILTCCAACTVLCLVGAFTKVSRPQGGDLLDGKEPDLVLISSPIVPSEKTLKLDDRWRKTEAEDGTMLWEADTALPMCDAAAWKREPERLVIDGATVPRDRMGRKEVPAAGRWALEGTRIVRRSLVRIFAPQQEASVEWETPGGRSRIGVTVRSRAEDGLEVPLLVQLDGEEIGAATVVSRSPKRLWFEVDLKKGSHTLDLANPARSDAKRRLEVAEVFIANPGQVVYCPRPGEQGPPRDSRLRFWELGGFALETYPGFPLPGASDARIQHARIATDLRRALLLGLPSTAEVSGITLRSGDRIDFALGLCHTGSEDAPSKTHLTVAFECGPERDVLLSVMPFKQVGDSEWVDQRIEITSETAGTGDLTFSVWGEEGARDARVIVGLAHPRVVRASSEDSELPNVLLVSIDTLRADHVGCYGYDKDTTPRIDSLARLGVRFANVEAQCSWTLPSHISMLTGHYPSALGMLSHGVSPSPDVVTFAERLRKAGMRTGAFVDCQNLHPSFGFYRGFDRFDYHYGRIFNNRRRAMKWIRTCNGAPFFMFFHVFDCHMPYSPPKRFRDRFVTSIEGVSPEIANSVEENFVSRFKAKNGEEAAKLRERDLRHMVDLYDGEIAHTDSQLGLFLDALSGEGLLENTLVIITSDHGEAFMEHGLLGHGQALYEVLTSVPLIFRFPNDERGVLRGRVVDDPVELVDLPATILEWLGLEHDPPTQGESLLEFAKGERPERVGECFGEFLRFAGDGEYQVFVRENNWKLISGNQDELYDLGNDPGEMTNVADREPGQLRVFHGEIEHFHEENKALFEAARPEERELDPSLAEELRALGYLK